MITSYTTEDGYTLRVFSSLYLSYGLEITKDDKSLFYSPHALACESWGADYHDEWDSPLEEAVEWTEEQWKERLSHEADDLICAYCEVD